MLLASVIMMMNQTGRKRRREREYAKPDNTPFPLSHFIHGCGKLYLSILRSNPITTKIVAQCPLINGNFLVLNAGEN